MRLGPRVSRSLASEGSSPLSASECSALTASSGMTAWNPEATESV